MSDWRVDLIATSGDEVCYGLVYETNGKLVHIHQEHNRLWVVRHLYAHRMVLHGAYNDLRTAVTAAEEVCR